MTTVQDSNFTQCWVLHYEHQKRAQNNNTLNPSHFTTTSTTLRHPSFPSQITPQLFNLRLQRKPKARKRCCCTILHRTVLGTILINPQLILRFLTATSLNVDEVVGEIELAEWSVVFEGDGCSVEGQVGGVRWIAGFSG